MKNLSEISNFIDTIDPGEPVYNISLYTGYGTEIQMNMTPWEAKNELKESDDWIKAHVGRNLRRGFNTGTNEMQLRDKEEILNEVRSHVSNMVTKIIMKTSPAEQPKRTKVFKELNEIAYRERKNDNFINDLIPVLSYYHSHVGESTDSSNVHRKNVFGLMDILRKKYGKSSS